MSRVVVYRTMARKTKKDESVVVYNYIIYAKDKVKTFPNGLLGPIDLHKYHFLLQNGREILEETLPSNIDPIAYYEDSLQSQEMVVRKSWKDGSTIYIEIDGEATHLESFTQYYELSTDADEDTLAWKTYWIPCNAGTIKECLGLMVCAATEHLGKNLVLSQILEKIMVPYTQVETP